MGSLWMTYLLAAAAASGVFVVAGWRSKTAAGGATAPGDYGIIPDPLFSEAELDPADDKSQADVGAALRLALKRLAPVMANQHIQAEVAAQSGLMVRMRGGALADMLEEMLVMAIHAAPASRLLLTTSVRGERVAVSITDDIPGADPELRRASIRALMERVAMRGGTLDIEVRPNEGTTTTLRLTSVRDSKTQPDLARDAASSLLPVSFGPVSFDMSR